MITIPNDQRDPMRLEGKLESKQQDHTGKTYVPIHKDIDKLIQKHEDFLGKYGFQIDERMKKLPYMYWTAKMHKDPTSQRFIAASASCTTKCLSNALTVILRQCFYCHANYCRQLPGMNRMWLC